MQHRPIRIGLSAGYFGGRARFAERQRERHRHLTLVAFITIPQEAFVSKIINEALVEFQIGMSFCDSFQAPLP